jgi:hypothetical protein
VPIFAAGDLPYQQTSVGTIGTQFWTNSPGGTALTSPRDITVVNAGTVGCYVTGGSIISLNGVWLAPGGQLTVQGTAQSALWGMTALGTTTTIASLASVVAVV